MPEHAGQRAAPGQEKPPVFDRLFLSVGAMKAGTTWIYDVLKGHPGIQVSYEKEIHYFYGRACRPGLLSDQARLRRARGYLSFDPDRSACVALRRRVAWTARWLDGPVDDTWFNRLFEGRAPGAWMAEFSNYNALLPISAWQDLAAKTRHLRVLYTLRHPLDRVWSHVRFHLGLQGKSHLLDTWSLDEVMAHIKSGDYLDHGDYVGAIDRLRAAVPEASVRIDFFDRISNDPEGFVRGIEGLLGLPHKAVDPAILNRVVNPAPAKPMLPGLADRMRPFVDQQIAGLRARGLDPPAEWDR